MMICRVKAFEKRRLLYSLTLIFIILSGFICTLKTPAFADGENKPQSEAVSAILFDAKRGQVLISKASDELSHSSIANRIMAVLITLEKADLESMVTASKDAAFTEGATLKLSVGERYSLRNLLHAYMLTSTPDAAKAICEFVGGTERGFVALMNEYASKIGMVNTNFTNLIGSYDENQHTTANDILILLKYAISNTNFNYFLGVQANTWYDVSKTVLLTNTNNMFWNYSGTDGGITASTSKNLQSIVTTATKNNLRLVCVLLDVPTKNMYNDSISLLNYGFDNYIYGPLNTAGNIMKTISVEGQTLNLITASDVYYTHPKGQYFIKNVTENIDETKLKPPITTKTVVGMMTYTLGDDTVINVELYPDREILPQKTKSQILKDRLKESRELIYVIIVLIIIEVIIVLVKLFGFLKKQIIKMNAKKQRLH